MNTRFFNWHDLAMIGLVSLIFCAISKPLYNTIDGKA